MLILMQNYIEKVRGVKMNKATEVLNEIKEENSFETRVDRAMKTTQTKHNGKVEE
jgi:hypothetical protein